MQKSKLTLAVIGALFATSVEAGSYVLQANKWGAAQANAVAKAGGTVRFANGDAGIAVVDSNNPNFLSDMVASRTISSGAADMLVQFTDPVGDIAVPDAVSPADDRFYSGVQWAPQAISAPGAWAAGYDGAGVRVAVIDGGIYNAHPDLAGAINTSLSTSFATGTANGCVELYNCDTGTFWHGTHVAGIIGARDNNIGVVGIAPKAEIIGVKALHGGTGSFGAIISAIVYSATTGGADIINMSLGAAFPRNAEGAARELMSALNRAVNFATARGSLVVVSAGNSGLDLDANSNLIVTPAESGNAIAISATGPLGFALGAQDFSRPASYSNYGNSMVWMSGPGGDGALPGNALCTLPTTTAPVTTACWVFDMVLSTSRGTNAAGGYSWAAGTSMAAPAVSAVAALIKQKYKNATPAQLKTKLAQSADDAGKKGQDNFHGHGFVNALRAVTQ